MNVYLDRGDGSLLGGGDTLLHAAHVRGQGGLVTHGGGDTTQQSGHLRTSLNDKYIVLNCTGLFSTSPK